MTGKIHLATSSIRHLGFGNTAQVMLCGTGWGGDIDSTNKPAVVTCGRCIARMRTEKAVLARSNAVREDTK